MDYKYLWDGSSLHWRLMRGEADDDTHYLIVDVHAKAGLIIEDDELAEQVIEKMLSAGIKIISPSEYVELTR